MNKQSIKKITLLFGDLAILYFGLYLALITRNFNFPAPDLWLSHIQAFLFIFIVWIIVFYINDFYDLKTSYNNFNLLSIITKTTIINGVIAVLMFYFLTPLFPAIKPQRILIFDLLWTLLLLFGWRKIFYNFIKSKQITNKILIIGDSQLAQELLTELQKRNQLGYQAEIITNLPENLKQYCQQNNIDIIINSENINNDSEQASKMFECLSLGIDIYDINHFYEQITQKIPVEHIKMIWFLENLSENSKKLYEIIKRALDIFWAILGLFLTLPLMPIIVLIIKLDSSGPIIFKQIRVGKNGKEFLAMKLRSMTIDAEKNGAQWAVKNDPRITRFGKFMRKTRLDEIPQLINVLKGEMSLIGPRPERPEFVKTLSEEIPFYRERLLIKPGLTGWAQLLGPAYGGSKEESLEKLKYDLYYIKNRSLLLDLSIILKTIRVVMGRRGQ